MKKSFHDWIRLRYFLLLFLVINLSESFKLKCPTSKQWIIRARSSCVIADGYICLFGENTNEFEERCRNKSYVQQAGFKFAIVGSLDKRKCERTRYQPFTFSTNGMSACFFEKTSCIEKGQIIFSNGSSNSDRQCRCDYTQGYDFITKPEHRCYCVPSKEDCSCYKKRCPAGSIISPDYQCSNLTSWDSQFTCELIIPDTPNDTKKRPNGNSLDDSAATPERNVKSFLSIVIGGTLFVMLMFVQITWLCLPKMESFNEEKKNVISENVALRSMLAGHDIQRNIRDLQQEAKKQWKEHTGCFVETRATNAMFQRIKEQQCFIICGPFGCGKSSSAFHIALKLEETFGFDFMIISNPGDLFTYASIDKKQIFLIDDAFGKYNVSNYYRHWWSAKGESVHQLVTKNTNLRLLLTSRLNIYRSLDLPLLEHRFCLFNLTSKEVALSYEERQMIGRCYLQEDIIDNLSEDVVMLYSFFPMLCETFNISSKGNIVEYFTNPVEYIKTDIGKFKQQSPDMFYLSLAVLVVFDNNVNKDIFSYNNRTFDRMLSCISKEIGYKRRASKQMLYSSFIALTDTYVSDLETNYACLHVTLFNVLAFCVGPKIIRSILLYGTTAFIINKMHLKPPCSQKYTIIVPNALHELYFNRMLLGMTTGLYNIFTGGQHVSAEFRESYIAYMKTHLKKEDLKKDIDAATVLHLVAAEGYADYVEYFLELDKQMVTEQDNTGQTVLHKTCVKGHLQVASLLLDNGACIDRSDNDSKTALDIACERNLSEMVNFLLSRDAKIRQKMTDFRTPLHVACNKGDFKITELLLKNNADVNEQDYHGYSPLHLACKNEYIGIATMLIKHNAIIDIANFKAETSLYIACKMGHFNVAELLLFNNADANNRNSIRNTPFLIACKNKHLELIRLLLKYEADVNCKNMSLLTPLHVACRNNNMDIILLLIKHGALVNEPDTNSQTPLFIACSKGYYIDMGKITKNSASVTTIQNEETHLQVDDSDGYEEIVKVLLNAGANVNQCDSCGITPIHLACKAQREKIVKLLINAGADVNRADKNGTTSIDIAREGEQNEILSLMINVNVNVNISDKHSMPPLHVACNEGSGSVVKTLLGMGANVNEMDNDEKTSLHVACKSGQEEIVTMLINAGVNLNKSDTNGVTPLHIACKDGNEEIVKMLLNSVANMKMIDKDGKTPLNVARKHGHNDIVTLLLNASAYGKRGDKNEITTLHMADKGEREVTTNEVSIGNVDDDDNLNWLII